MKFSSGQIRKENKTRPKKDSSLFQQDYEENYFLHVPVIDNKFKKSQKILPCILRKKYFYYLSQFPCS